MSEPLEHAEYCPFLDRGDRRCSAHLNLDNLEHALDHCFNRYKACPIHMQLSVASRVQQIARASVSVTLTFSPANDSAPAPRRQRAANAAD
jgi:hypothetical protein